MKEFKSSRGHTFVFGRNMWTGDDDAGVFSWNDPATGSWELSVDNEAGCIWLPVDVCVDPAVREDDDGNIIVAERFKVKWCGKPFIWGVEEIK